MSPSRRDVLKALAGAPLLVAPQRSAAATTVNGVVFGVETFSFHDLPPAGDPQLIPTIVKNLQTLGIAECEIMSGHIEPFASVMTGWWVQSRRAPDFARLREEARQWLLTVPMTYYRDIRRRFEDAGLRIHLYNVNFNETFTDAERDRTFEAARESRAQGFSSSTVLSEARRLVPFVKKHKMFVAMHNHNNLADPDQFATPASFETALAMSPLFYVTLDIGHFTAGNNDAVAFIRQHHDRIINIHVRDRQAEQRPEPAVRAGRHADRRGAPSHQRQPLLDSVLPRIRVWVVQAIVGRSQDLLRLLQARAGGMTAIKGVRWYVLLTSIVAMLTIGLRLEARQERDAGGFKAPTAALERGRAVYVLNHCHFCHGVDLTRATMGAANLSQSPLVGADEDGNMIGPLVKAGLPNLQTAMPSYVELTSEEMLGFCPIHSLSPSASTVQRTQPPRRRASRQSQDR